MFNQTEIIDNLREEYLNSKRPWIIGFSGGKDSTCLVQMVYEMLLSIDPTQRSHTVHVLTTNTMVETPAIALRMKRLCNDVQTGADRDGIPLDVQLLRPKITDTFWVNLIGRGYPSPNKWFRWCTSRLKIKPMDDYILSNVKRNGEVLILLGTRKAESSNRARSLEKHEIEDSKLRKHGTIKGAFVYAPLENMSDQDVWDYLLENNPGWGGTNEELYKLYAGETAEISFIMDGRAPPSGTSRFGCWTCTVVERDKAIQCLIDEGHDEYIPLREFRNKLKQIRDDPNFREPYRKNQRLDQLYDEFYAVKTLGQPHAGIASMGPFTMAVRHELLVELLSIQDKLRETVPEAELITPEEITAIKMAWIYDGDTQEDIDKIIRSTNSVDEIGALTDRLLSVEQDMSDVSRRIGIYSKLEKAVLEYSISKLSERGGTK
ncbi:MAG: DNA phosphorothioation system sulfurtransferase DndC [Candidatus Methanomethylophilaceae archaeon]|nr:DNA phosphorothioation system sulfurtransferase DndC [Candidatus Methanomethylophilaceae archaeon]